MSIPPNRSTRSTDPQEHRVAPSFPTDPASADQAKAKAATRFQDLFEAQVQKSPDVQAVVDPVSGESLNFRELNFRANALAFELARRGFSPEDRVGLLLGRSLDMIVGILGVLKSGCAYVPLDPEYPLERLTWILQDAGLHALLTHSPLAAHPLCDRSRLQQNVEIIDIGPICRTISRRESRNPRSQTSPHNTAYVIYTSGTAGRPKGVLITHRALAWYTTVSIRNYSLTGRDRVLQFSSTSFDISVEEIFPCLACGATLILRNVSIASSVAEFCRMCREWTITALFLPTAFWHLLAREVTRQPTILPSSLRLLSFGGEPVIPERVLDWQRTVGSRVSLFNGYGPTETTVVATLSDLTDPGNASQPEARIGTPIPGAQVFVLDRHVRRVSQGSVGELFIGGLGLSRGYLNQPQKTAQRFVPHPFSPKPGKRLYRTGDLVRLHHTGDLEFLGRLDNQIKIHGYRIEPAEIEAYLTRHPRIQDAVVVARELSPGDLRMMAYLVADKSGGEPPTSGELRSYLKPRLPHYMLPSTFNLLEEIPLDANGKIDRRALRRGQLPAVGGTAVTSDWRSVAARTPIEATLAEIFSEILRLDTVGVHDNIFELGADSIINLQVVGRAKERDLHLTPRDLFENQTIAAIAAVGSFRDTQRGNEPTVISEQGRITGPVPLTPIQRWFFYDACLPVPWHFNQAAILEVRRPLNQTILAEAVTVLIEHHDAFRLRFEEVDGEWRQTNADVANGDSPPFLAIDLSNCRRASLPLVVRGVANRLQASLNLERGPLLRLAYFERGPLPARLCIIVHHLVVDGVSWGVLVADLESAYLALEAGRDVTLPRKSTSYKAWSETLLAHANSPKTRNELDYWLEVPRLSYELPLDFPERDPKQCNIEAAAGRVTVALDAEHTRYLLREVPAAYRTQINDVLLSALALTVKRWSRQTQVLIELEGHGREEVGQDIDLSHTVGWFTSTFPVFLDISEAEGPAEVLKAIKEQLRTIPRRGIGHSLLRYLNDDPVAADSLARLPQPHLVFNYLGQIDPHFAKSTLFTHADEPTGRRCSHLWRRSHLHEITSSISEDRLWVYWKYCTNLHSRSTIERIAQIFIDELKALIVHCLDPQARGYTASDFPLAELSTNELQEHLDADRNIEDIYPLSPMQEGILFHTLYTPGKTFYFEQWSWSLRGPLDAQALRQAWEHLLERHPVLRTAFLWRGLEQPLQIVRRQVNLPWQEEGWEHYDEKEQAVHLRNFAAVDRRRGFDLSIAPLMRCQLIKLDETRFRFIWSVHHLLLDGWSISIIFDELIAYYRALRHSRHLDRPRPRSYRSYIVWMKDLDSPASEEFWRRDLAGFTAPTPLPFDSLRRGDSLRNSGEIVQHEWKLSAATTATLQAFARRHHLTLNTLAQAAWALILSRHSAKEDVLFGTIVSGRPPSLRGADTMVGLFVNALPVRVQIKNNETLLSFLTSIQQRNVNLRENGFNSLVEIQGWSELPRQIPLFESSLAFHNYPLESITRTWGDQLEVEDLAYFSHTNYPFSISFDPDRELQIQVRYDPARFAATAAARIMNTLTMLLEGMFTDAGRHLGEISLASAPERHQILVEWNDTRESYPPETCAHELFVAQAERTPDALALLYDESDHMERTLTYHQLHRQSDKLAVYLQDLGVESDTVVAIAAERSREMVIGILGVLKAGGAFLPLDPSYPRQRLAFMLQDSRTRILLTQRHLKSALPSGDEIHTLCLDSDTSLWSAASDRRPRPTESPSRGAYVIYTSGSTGRPKGVLISHSALNNCLLWVQRTYRLEPTDRVLQKTAPGFDVSVQELLWPLISGAQLILARSDGHRDTGYLVDLIRRRSVTTVNFVPSQLQALVCEPELKDCINLRCVISGGEALSASLLRDSYAHLPANARLCNLYGPTEATIQATHWPGDRRFSGTIVPIGRPLANTTSYLLDQRLAPVPLGTPGELVLGGTQLGRGYLGRPVLTAEKFIPDPFSKWPDTIGARLYRTGDLARFRSDGSLEYLGRIDEQVKVRGFRIELGEIKATLEKHPNARDVVVTTWEESGSAAFPQDTRLVAYVVPEISPPPDARREESLVERWRILYEDLYSRDSAGASGADLEKDEEPFDLSTWTSVYDDQPVPIEQMREWVEPTVGRILELKPQRLLELGCGTGLLLLRIAPHCEFYQGTDFSPSVIGSLRSRVGAKGFAQVDVRCQAADDLTGIDLGTFDTVVINSVIQYFPTMDYLLRVLQGAQMALAPGGRIFIGDVPSLPQLDIYSASIELHRADDTLTDAELRDRIKRRARLAEQMLIHPEAFFALQHTMPRIGYVHIQPRGGRTRNELTRFAFDVICYLDCEEMPAEEARSCDSLQLHWHDDCSPQILRQLLEENRPQALAVSGVLDLRLWREARLLELLHGEARPLTVAEIRRAIDASEARGVEPDDLRSWCCELGYAVELRGPDYGANATFDMLLRPLTPGVPRRYAPVLAHESVRTWNAYANSPFSATEARNLGPRLREFLMEVLPEYMCPSAFVTLSEFPRLSNGKIDLRALPAPESTRAPSEASFTQPRNQTEETLAEIWNEVLGIEKISVHDNFFDLGGHSLLATQVVSRIRQRFRIEVTLASVFEATTIERLASHLDNCEEEQVPGSVAVEVVPPAEQLPLSFAQQRLWLLDQMVPGGMAYNMPVDPWRIEGPLDIRALEAALREIVRRHQVLRTIFKSVDGIPRQVIIEEVTLRLPIIDLTGLSPDARRQESRRLAVLLAMLPFDLTHGPLLHVALLRLAERQYVFCRTNHHIVSDGWSEGLITAELTVLYQAFRDRQSSPLPEISLQYSDFALWQRGYMRGEVLERHLGFWRRQLAGLPQHGLPTDRPRPTVQSYYGGITPIAIPGNVTHTLRGLSSKSRASLFMTLLAGFMVLVRRYTRQDDTVVGSPIANRNRKEIESLIGFFVNTLALRGDLSGNPRFIDLLKQVRETSLEAYAHQDLPFERLVEELRPERQLNRFPLFQIVFALQNAPDSQIRLADLEVFPQEMDFAPVTVDLILHLWEGDEGLFGFFVYDRQLFDATHIRRIGSHYERLLGEIAACVDQEIDRYGALSRSEVHQILHEWNDTAGRTPFEPFHRLVEAQTDLRPGAVALRFTPSPGQALQELSYREVDARANQLAHVLRTFPEVSDRQEPLIGLAIERSPEMILARLAILKAGGAFLPLDPTQPTRRLTYIVEDSRTPFVLTQEGLRGHLPEGGPRLVTMEQILRKTDLASADRLDIDVAPEQLAYVIYTSGSTGQPKGASLCHRGLSNLATDLHLETRSDDVLLQFASPGFDGSVSEMAMCFAAGATLDLGISGPHPVGDELASLLGERGITQAELPTAALSSCPPAAASRSKLRTLLVAGEACPAQLPVVWGPPGGRQFLNGYGPTEATVCVTIARCSGDGRKPPIGRPIQDTRVHVLNAQARPVPVGTPGELHVAGDGLARGYLHRPRLTAEHFIPDPFASHGGERLYKTGDLVRYTQDGNLDFLGRVDTQVKLRGFRIELGEIESVLSRHPAIDDAVVEKYAVENSAADTTDSQLVAYVVPKDVNLARAQSAAEQVASWQGIHDDIYLNRKEGSRKVSANFDIVGWVSSFTGEAIPDTEMKEWLEETVERILGVHADTPPGAVLEIGCGTGLLLWRIASHARRYVGVDFSPSVIEQLAAALAGSAPQLPQVELRCQKADDFGGIDQGAFSLVILNSVVQYFPSVEYLLQVLDGAVAACGPGGAVYLGDLRSLPLHEAFCTGVELTRAASTLVLDDLRQLIAERRVREKELLLDPALFYALAQRLPRITQVRITPKLGRGRNEMNCFRYDVLLHLDGADFESNGRTTPDLWLNWRPELTPEALQAELARHRDSSLGLRRIPDARVSRAVQAATLLARTDSHTVAELGARLALPEEGIEPAALQDLAQELELEIEWLGDGFGHAGCYDVIFWQPPAPRRPAVAPTPVPTSPIWQDWANDPLAVGKSRELLSILRRDLEESLPGYMIPGWFILLPRLPLGPSGKIDRQRLPAPGREVSVTPAAARTPAEEQLLKIWREVLALKGVGIHDNFFELGGHSLNAAQVQSRIEQTFSIRFPLRSLFEHPTVVHLAALVERLQTLTNHEKTDAAESFEKHIF